MKRFLFLEMHLHMDLAFSDVSKCKVVIRVHLVFQFQEVRKHYDVL